MARNEMFRELCWDLYQAKKYNCKPRQVWFLRCWYRWLRRFDVPKSWLGISILGFMPFNGGVFVESYDDRQN